MQIVRFTCDDHILEVRKDQISAIGAKSDDKNKCRIILVSGQQFEIDSPRAEVSEFVWGKQVDKRK